VKFCVKVDRLTETTNNIRENVKMASENDNIYMLSLRLSTNQSIQAPKAVSLADNLLGYLEYFEGRLK
jgi:hypothetical protein